MKNTTIRAVTDDSLILDHSRIAHVMRIGKERLESDVKVFIDEAARMEELAGFLAEGSTKDQHTRGAEGMRAMAREFERYVQEASEVILTLEAACEYGAGRVAIVGFDTVDLEVIRSSVTEMLEEG